MKINNLKINNFGNLNNKEIKLSEHINIIQGENESGKSTLLKFIVDIFFGISKNKRGKKLSDYERYKPWNGEEFSGKLKYTLNNNKKYEIFRDFNKKNPKIYNENSEDISKQFNIDKTYGNQFFVEQTNIDENMFTSTLVSMQQEVRLDKNVQNILVQKIANLTTTGDDSISYKKAIEKINKKQIEEIGTSRSQGRPLNIIKEEKNKLEKEIEELNLFKNKKYEIEEEKNELEKKIKSSEAKYELIKKIKEINERETLEKEKINLNEKIKINNSQKINELLLEKNKIQNKLKNNYLDEEKNKSNNLNVNKNLKNATKNKSCQKVKYISITFIIIFLITLIGNFTYTKNEIIQNLSLFFILLGCILFLLSIYIQSKDKKLNIQQNNIKEETKRQKTEMINELNIEINKINSQIEILEKNNEIQLQEIDKINEKINFEINLEKDKIKNSYLNNKNNEEDLEEINNLLNETNINFKLDLILNELNKNKLEYHSLELDKNNIIPKLEKLSFIEEQLEEINQKEKDLELNNLSIELAKEMIEKSYIKMKENITPKFSEDLSKNISKISNGKYNKIKIHDEDGIIVEKDNGEYISAEQLSVGTIDQLYLSLRFAMIKEISKEDMPIILDEAFAYYDNNRLENIFNYLNEEFKDNQIIIFTCTNREKEILDKLNIKYNLEKIAI